MKYLLFLIFFLFFTQNLLAQEHLSLADQLIASTFKTLAKAYAAGVDLEKIKKNQIVHLQGMKSEKFQKQFNKARSTLNTLPAEFKTKYGLKDRMTKEEVIQEISELDKKKINQMIEDIPDKFIVSQFKQYMAGLKQDVQESSAAQKIHEFWAKMTSKAQK